MSDQTILATAPLPPSDFLVEAESSAHPPQSTFDEFHYFGTIQRFFQSEVKPVYFGNQNEAFLLLKVIASSLVLVNFFGILVFMQYDPHPPSTHHHGLLHLLDSFSSAFTAYHADGQVVVGWLLAGWFLGFNAISGLIWWQFERTDRHLADDYEIVVRQRRRNGNGKGEGMNPFDKSIVVVTMPSGEFSVAKKQKPPV